MSTENIWEQINTGFPVVAAVFGAVVGTLAWVFSFGRKAQKLEDMIRRHGETQQALEQQVKNLVKKQDLDDTLDRIRKDAVRDAQVARSVAEQAAQTASKAHTRIDSILQHGTGERS